MALNLTALREATAGVAPLTLGMAGVVVGLASSHDDISRDLAAYFRPLLGAGSAGLNVYAVQGEPAIDMNRLVDLPVKPGRLVKEAVYPIEGGQVIYKRRTGVAIVVQAPNFYIVGDLRRNLNQVHNLVGHVLARAFMGQGYAMLHCSAVSVGNRGIAFGARSGGGKSTAALAVLERGGRFVSNDRLFVRAKGGSVEMLGMPKWPRVNPGTLLRLPSLTAMLPEAEQAALNALPPQELWDLEQKHDVDVDEVFGPGTNLFQTVHLDTLYLLDWSLGGEGLRLTPVAPEGRLVELQPLVKRLGPYGSTPALEAASDQALLEVASALQLCTISGLADPLRLAGALTQGEA